MNSYGVYQNAYKTEVPEFRDSSTLAISFVGSVTSASYTVLSDVYGPRVVALAGGLIMCLSMVLASLTTSLWQLLLTQGLLFGVSIAFSQLPGLGLISDWFYKRRGLANGVAIAGGGVGGLALGPILRLLLTQVGWRWTLRVIALSSGLIICATAWFLKSRTHKRANRSLDLSLFKDWLFIRLYLVGVFQAFAYFTPFYFVPTFAVQNGMTKEQGALLVGLMNGTSAVGRIVLGMGADAFGFTNALTICYVLTALSVLFIWPFSTSFGLLAFFSCFFGFFVGGFISVTPSVIAKLFGHRGDISTTVGMIFTGYTIGNLFGSPIAGAIIDMHTTYSVDGQKTTDFLPAIIYSGVGFTIGTLIVFTVRYSAGNGRFFIKV
eukprot:jgi/Hompol1/3115/HPOL_006346-RA